MVVMMSFITSQANSTTEKLTEDMHVYLLSDEKQADELSICWATPEAFPKGPNKAAAWRASSNVSYLVAGP